LGSRVGYSADQIAAVEQGRRIPKTELIDKIDEVLDAGEGPRVFRTGF
jgi:transcriptional regulator with XRE-family HTH domain